MEQYNVSLYIMTDGSRTVAEASMYKFDSAEDSLGHGTHGSGSSGREPGDKYDARTGNDLAAARALRSLAARLERRARGRVSHAESVKAHKAEIAELKAAEAPPVPVTGDLTEAVRDGAKSLATGGIGFFNTPR